MSIAFILIGAVICGAPVALAQEGSADAAATGQALEARRAMLFAAMLRDPSDLDVAFEYAMLSAQAGDYEGAIATLERMLIFAPNLPRVQLELGVLYYRIGARETARGYFDAVVSGSDVPPAVRERVDLFLAQIDDQDRRLTYDGAVFLGMRYQSNANAAPEDSLININGQSIVLNPSAQAQADGNVFFLGNLHFAYDLRNQGDLIEADITTYNAFYFDLSRLNLNLIEATVGPSFSLGRFGLGGARLGLYGIAGATALDGTGYGTDYGGGISLQARLHERLLYDSVHEVRAVNYLNSPDYPTVRLQTGDEYRNRIQLTGLLGARFTLTGSAEMRNLDARVPYESFDEFGFSARSNYLFYGPGKGFLADDAPWAVSLGAGALWRDYDGPDPLINPVAAEHDDTYWIEAGLTVPLEHRFGLFVSGQLRTQNSNYPTRDFTNAIISAGLVKRF